MPTLTKDRKPKTSQIIAVGCTLIVIVLAFILFLNMNNSRIENQNAQYLQSSADQSVRRIDEWMSDSQAELELLTSLYETSISSASQVDINMISQLGRTTKFDYITYSAADGTTFIEGGTPSNASDREYFIKGMQGETGVCSVSNSLFFDDLSVIFYTPLKINGQVAGVIAGAYRQDLMNEFLATYFVDVRTDTYLCTPDGQVMAFSSDHGDEGAFTVQELFFTANDTQGADELLEALRTGESLTFTFANEYHSGLGNATQLPHYDLTLIRTFPSAVTARMQTNANFAGIILITIVAAALIALMGYFLLQAFRKRRELQDESEQANEIILASLNLFQRFAVVDLDHGTFRYLKEDAGKMNMNDEHSYADFRQAWTNNLADPEDEIAIELAPERIREKLRNDVPFEQIEYRTLDRTTNTERWAQGSIIALSRDARGEVKTVLMAVSDVTEMKQRELRNHIALEHALRTAEEASRAKTDFLNSMSHDIRTPMNSIMGLTTIASMYIDDPERVKDCLNKITSSSRHLLSLINEVLDMAKIESGKLSLSEESFDLSEVVEGLLSILTPQANDKGLELKVELEDIVHEHLMGDPMRLQQIFVNIMGNSVKFTPEGGIVGLRIRELTSQIPGSAQYQFIFSDTGCGMSEEFLKTVFEPFTRANDSRVTQVEGTGLGMSIVRSVVNLMHGTIDVESELGKGTTFTVTVYMKLREEDEPDVAELQGLSVLVADDDPMAGETACEMLRSLGMDASIVTSGDEAVAVVQEAAAADSPFSAVILDWKMPGKSGVETAQEIRANIDHALPIIILSAYDWSAIEQEARDVGVDAFIAKPLFRSRLAQVMRSVLSSEEASQSAEAEALTQSDFSGNRVLLTEDNLIGAAIAQDILGMTGIDVEHAKNGREAVEMLLNAEPGHFDLVLMDVQMPVMNGYEASRAIRAAAQGTGLDGEAIDAREDLATIPIIALTADAFADDIAKALAAGMNAHMSKPMEIDVLIRTLEEWL